MVEFLSRISNANVDPYGAATLLKVALIAFVLIVVRFVILAVPAYLVCWRWLRDRVQHRRIQQRFPAAFRLWNEAKWSFSTFLVYTVLSVGTYVLFKAGYTLNYRHISDRGWGYFAFSILLMILLHDAYFYWTHRFLHLKPVFKVVHRVHHESLNPSPWAAFSFHPLEAVVSFGILPLIIFTIPFHVTAIQIFLIYMTALNVLGHLGYEFFPRGFTKHWLSGWYVTSTHHNLHHSRTHCNYGLYFMWWDRWFGTNHADYHRVFDDVASRTAPRTGAEVRRIRRARRVSAA